MNVDITGIINWFRQAKPSPTIEDACVQIGCHYEEVGEMSVQLDDSQVAGACYDYSDSYKENLDECIDAIRWSNKENLLDALCDQIVTAIGVAHMIGMDIQGALNEVNRSNWSKFVDGKPVLDANGKIAKPDTYSKPELGQYTDPTNYFGEDLG